MGVNIINNFPPGGYVGPVPRFMYSGQYQMLNDGNGDWRLKLLTSGVLMFTGSGDLLVDIFLVGGGNRGEARYERNSGTAGGGWYFSAGGGGGYTLTEIAQMLSAGAEYTVTVGAAAGTTSLGSYSARGGLIGSSTRGGDGGSGGSGGGSALNVKPAYCAGGRDGANGNNGKGQGTTTREFGESNGELYSNGGDCDYDGGAAQTYAETNHGHGGHGVTDTLRNAGQPGVVIIRNHRRAAA